jgi:hypothetical protein
MAHLLRPPQTPFEKKLRTTNVIERCFLEVRGRNRPIVCLFNVSSVNRIIYAIFHGLNEDPEWKISSSDFLRRKHGVGHSKACCAADILLDSLVDFSFWACGAVGSAHDWQS